MAGIVTGRLFYAYSKETSDRFEYQKNIGIGPLEIVRLAAFDAGFKDVDAEPTENGWKVTVTAEGRSLTARGKTQTEACASLLGQLE